MPDTKNSTRPLPAFPTDINGDWGGMTLRDYFAASMLTGLMAHASVKHIQPSGVPEMAHACYVMADAMMQERDK